MHWRRGTVAHAAMQAAYEAARDRQPAVLPYDTRMDLFYDIADDALFHAWSFEEMPDDDEARDRLREQVRLVLAKLKVPRPANIVGVEVEARATLDGGTPVRSYLDVALRLAPDWLHVRDWKTYSKLPTEEELRRSVQLPLYGAMAQRMFPWAKRVSVSIYSIPANAETPPVLLTADELAEVQDRVEAIADAAETDDVCMPQPSEWCDTCSHKQFCPIFNPEAGIGPQVDRRIVDETREALAAIEGF